MKHAATLTRRPNGSLLVMLPTGFGTELRPDARVADILTFLHIYGEASPAPEPLAERPLIACPMEIGDEDDHVHD